MDLAAGFSFSDVFEDYKSTEKISAVLDLNLIIVDELVEIVFSICSRHSLQLFYLSLHQPSHESPDGNLQYSLFC